MSKIVKALKGWEGFLLAVLLIIVIFNASLAPEYLQVNNWINLFQLSIEKIIVALIMTFIIINAEIDLSVASTMGLTAAVLAWMNHAGHPFGVAIAVALGVGVLAGAFNGFWISYVGLPSLVVTLATMIMYRGGARVFMEDKSFGNFPEWFNHLGQQALIGPLPIALILFGLFVILAIIVLQYSGFGRVVYVVGNNRDVARYSGINVRRHKLILFTLSGAIAGLAGILFAARLGAVRGDTATGFELDIITMVLLGGVSIFGGSGSIYGVLLSILIVLNLRNGMSLLNLTGHLQTGVIGTLLILSVLLPNLAQWTRSAWNHRKFRKQAGKQVADVG
jgi:rhamnose transport system permease protein